MTKNYHDIPALILKAHFGLFFQLLWVTFSYYSGQNKAKNSFEVKFRCSF